LYFQNINVTSYNGINVDWKNTAVYLPPGKVQMTMDYNPSYAVFDTSIIPRFDLLFERTFDAGERYSLFYRPDLCLDTLLMLDLNEKKNIKDQTIHNFPRAQKTILPGASEAAYQTGEAKVVFGEGILVINYNGKNVYDEYYSSSQNYHSWRLHEETLSAGASTINFDVYFVDHKINVNVIPKIQNLEVTWNFEAGREYTIAVYSKLLNPFLTEYVIAIYDFASKTGKAGSASQIIKSWKFGEFLKPTGKFTWFSLETGKPK